MEMLHSLVGGEKPVPSIHIPSESLAAAPAGFSAMLIAPYPLLQP